MIKIKAQAWSMDIALAVVLFIVTFFVIYNITTTKTTSDSSILQKEAEIILEEAISQNSSLSLVNDASLNESKLQDILEKDYTDLKKKIRVQNEFCVYFEDDEGNMLNITNASGIGSSKIDISGVACR